MSLETYSDPSELSQSNLPKYYMVFFKIKDVFSLETYPFITDFSYSILCWGVRRASGATMD